MLYLNAPTAWWAVPLTLNEIVPEISAIGSVPSDPELHVGGDDDQLIDQVGRQQEIEVGPMSGKSNVVFWLESRGLPATDEIVDRVFAAAKASNRTLTHEQVQRVVGGEAKLKPAGARLHHVRRKGF